MHRPRRCFGASAMSGEGLYFAPELPENPAILPSLRVVTVHREEPLPVKLIRQTEKLPLSQRQTQICLLMAGGHTYPAIARRIGISEHTAVTHSRQIYAKFDVHNRSELVLKLLLL